MQPVKMLVSTRNLDIVKLKFGKNILNKSILSEFPPETKNACKRSTNCIGHSMFTTKTKFSIVNMQKREKISIFLH